MTFDMLLGRLRALPLQTKFAGAAVLALVLGGFVVAGLTIAKSPGIALFASPLRPEQLREVEDELAGWSVTFTPTADNVIVHAAARNDLLLRLSLAGIPHAHVQTTDEALANVGVLTPQSVVDAQTRSGLAGDIELGLRSIAGIDDARVIVAPAKAAGYSDESAQPATAAVRLRMHPGATLSSQAIAGIQHFVAASVPGLDAQHVTILDDAGVALTERGEASADAGELQQSLQSALDAAFGPGTTIVRVHAEYSGAGVDRREVRRTAVGATPIERTEDSESYDGAGKRYQKRSGHDDNGADVREIVSHADPGVLTSIASAIFVDESRAADVPKVRELAAAAIGYNPKRGDSLVVQAVNFHRALEPRNNGWFLLYAALAPLLPALAFVAGAFMLVRTGAPVVMPWINRLTERFDIERTSKTVAGYSPARVRGVLMNEPPHAAAAIISALPTATAAAVLELYPAQEREAIVKRMQRAASPLVPHVDEVLDRYA